MLFCFNGCAVNTRPVQRVNSDVLTCYFYDPSPVALIASNRVPLLLFFLLRYRRIVVTFFFTDKSEARRPFSSRGRKLIEKCVRVDDGATKNDQITKNGRQD